MRECSSCNWLTALYVSTEKYVYICADSNSSVYLEETGVCSSCELEEILDDEG